MLKRFFIISSVLLGIILFLWLFYFFFFSSKKTEDSPTITEIKPSSQEENTLSPTLKQFTDIPLLSAKLSEDGTTLYGYHSLTATLYAIDTETYKKTVLLDTNLINPLVGIWSKNNPLSLLKTQPQGGSQYFLIDSDLQTVSALQDDIHYLTWDSLSEKIVYINRKSPGSLSFYTANPNGSSPQEILTIEEKEYIDMTAIPESPLIAYWPESSNVRISPLYSVNLSTKKKNTLFSGKYGASYLFSPNGKTILVSWAPEKNSSRLSLATINGYGGEYTDLGLPTLTSKCTWNTENTSLYCAVPTNIPSTAIMPDDYLKGEFHTTDVFWKITLATGEKERIIKPEDIPQSFDATNLLLSPGEQKLYFTDKVSGNVYEIAL